MYNTKFLPLIEKFRENLFGAGAVDTRGASAKQDRRYSPPLSVKILKCYRDTNGEWVPKSKITNPKSLEGRSDSK